MKDNLHVLNKTTLLARRDTYSQRGDVDIEIIKWCLLFNFCLILECLEEHNTPISNKYPFMAKDIL